MRGREVRSQTLGLDLGSISLFMVMTGGGSQTEMQAGLLLKEMDGK